MCWLVKTFCTQCQHWTEVVDRCPKFATNYPAGMPCYGPNVVFFFQTAHIKTVYNGLCPLHKQMDELAKFMHGMDMMGAAEEKKMEAKQKMDELEAALLKMDMGGNGEQR